MHISMILSFAYVFAKAFKGNSLFNIIIIIIILLSHSCIYSHLQYMANVYNIFCMCCLHADNKTEEKL